MFTAALAEFEALEATSTVEDIVETTSTVEDTIKELAATLSTIEDTIEELVVTFLSDSSVAMSSTPVVASTHVDPPDDDELSPHDLYMGMDPTLAEMSPRDLCMQRDFIIDAIDPDGETKVASCHLVEAHDVLLAEVCLPPPSSPSPAQVLSLGSKGDIPLPQLYELLMGSEGDVDDHHVITPYHHLKPKSLMSMVDIISFSTPSQLYVQQLGSDGDVNLVSPDNDNNHHADVIFHDIKTKPPDSEALFLQVLFSSCLLLQSSN